VGKGGSEPAFESKLAARLVRLSDETIYLSRLDRYFVRRIARRGALGRAGAAQQPPGTLWVGPKVGCPAASTPSLHVILRKYQFSTWHNRLSRALVGWKALVCVVRCFYS
jgi:hypothetical protein